ncbi:hypothetical protein DM01DRAFT_1156404 [Hesseltinella vesiculosa]|uniref:Prospore membrane adapter protein SPO71 PH domain-containing protein n=1 Tax=Hesseltinella vesiculosa TaxID=101127 RepID=A0A1X2GT96_9FUNG|nr:hypothetical protein DM01DRAFT_1156404 [Hesseltinella vesiculosa]
MSANVCKDRLGCSYRILIGPLNEKSPEPGYCTAPSEPLTTPPAATHESTTPTKQRHLDASPATSPDRPSQQNSVSQDSYMTASSSFQQPQENTPSALAMSVPSPSPPTSIASSTASTHTVRPLHKSSALQDSFSRRLHKIKQGRSYLQPHFTHTHASAHFHQPLQQPLHLLWRKAGPVFMPRLPAPSDSRQASLSGNNVVLKHDILLCSAIIGMSLQPSAYHSQNHHTRRDPGRQLEAVLTPSSLSCYDSPGWLWPGRKCHYCIPLNDASKPVSLRLLSPLDYSFSVFVGQGKDAMMVMFVARCKSLCLEWYLALYRLLSDHGKCTLPLACDVYVPSLDLQLQIPMVFDKTTRGDNNDEQDPRYYITAEQVKDAVLDLLEEDNLLYRKDMELCWVHGDRAEWVYWQYDLNLQHRSDLIMGPQTIEHTHQLQLRQIQHLPRKVVLKDRVELKEPFPVEGFLHKVSNFKGQVNKPVWKHQKYYFATFQWFLFYTPAHKIQLPDTCTFVPVNQDLPWHPALSSLNQATSPYITLISPFASHPQVCESWQTDELGRRMALIKHAKGCIDLTEVLYVQRSFCDVTDALLTSSAISSEGASSTTPFLASAQPNYQTDQTRRNNHTCFIVLVMKNGLTVKLKCYM